MSKHIVMSVHGSRTDRQWQERLGHLLHDAEDGWSIRDVEQYGDERFLEALGAVLRAGAYRATVIRRRYIPKADGRPRPLGMPTVRDRCC
jgi:hypothetical protein